MPEIHDEMLAAEAARQFLGISRTTMHRLLTSGELHGSKVGGQWRFRRADLEAYLERKPHGLAAVALPELEVELRWWIEATSGEMPEEEATVEQKIAVLADNILALAVARHVSDIHLEPQPHSIRIRFRHDGVLSEVRLMPSSLLPPLVRYWKELAIMNGDDVCQEGRLMLTIAGLPFSVILATLPVLDGEAMTISLQQRPSEQALRFEMEDLGLTPEALQQVKEWLGKPSGLILVAGPLESGKVTTLHTLAGHVNTPDRKVLIFEDPTEMLLPGALQVKAKHTSGISFFSLLRSGLSQDPDIIVVSEAADLSTVELLAQGALTGHLMISTISTHSFSQTIEKMDELGLEPFITSDVLVGIVAQRLVRRICSGCVTDDKPNPALIERARQLASEGGYEIPDEVHWKRGAGCSRCRQMGLMGRIALYEVVTKTDELAEVILRGAGAAELDRLARAQGSKSLFAEGVREAVAGRISLAQLFRTMALPALA